MKKAKISLMIISLMFFAACSKQTQIVYVKQRIASNLLECKNIDYSKYEMSKNSDLAIFLIDLNDSYLDCKYRLELIRREYGN